MLCASAVDAMLKEKGHQEGTLNQRINKAVEDHLLTQEMGDWAHHVRLEANDPRHADKDADIPTQEQAEQSIEFTEALAEILFVLNTQGSQRLTYIAGLHSRVAEGAMISSLDKEKGWPMGPRHQPAVYDMEAQSTHTLLDEVRLLLRRAGKIVVLGFSSLIKAVCERHTIC
jgi:hypothetical protein